MFTEEIKNALEKLGYKQKDLALLTDASPSTICNILDGQKPKDNLFAALCGSAWPDPATGLCILKAWLEDEIKRGGHNLSEIEVVIHGDDPVSRHINEQIASIRQWLPANPDILPIINHIADAAKRELEAKNAQNSKLMAAEPETLQGDDTDRLISKCGRQAQKLSLHAKASN